MVRRPYVVVPLLLLLIVYHLLWKTEVLDEDPVAIRNSTSAPEETKDTSEHSDTISNASTRISWLLSFPNSGTSYTLVNTMQVSQLGVATNYADESRGAAEPLWNDGPFWLGEQPHAAIPLIKSHCDANALTYDTFELGCRAAVKQETTHHYEIGHVDRAVHLIRSPLDNLVARKHMAVRQRLANGRLNATDAQRFNDTEAGMAAWCRYYDDQTVHILPKATRATVLRLSQTIPCVVDLVSYIKWHNLATRVLSEHKIPTLTLYYEDYATNYNRTLDELLSFLDLPRVGAPIDFVGNTYRRCYTGAHVRLIRDLIERYADATTWKLLERYF